MEKGKILEVRIQLESEKKRLDTWQDNETIQVSLTISFDMGWNKISYGNRYNSLSGHPFIVGCLSGKIIAGTVTTKNCRLCFTHKIKGNEPLTHD